MSSRHKHTGVRTPKPESYKVQAVGNLPIDLSDRISALHAEAVLRRSCELVAENADYQATEGQA